MHTHEDLSALSSAALSLSSTLTSSLIAADLATSPEPTTTAARSPLRCEILDPAALTPADRRRLADELYAAHRRIFAGVRRSAFTRYVVDSPADETSIAVYRDALGVVVGYVAFHQFEREVDGQAVTIVRAEAGIDRRYRGANVATPFFIDRLVRVMLGARGRPLYYLGSLVHPSSYALFARYADRVWPNPEVDTPRPLRRLMDRLAGEFHLERVDPADTLVRDVGWRTREFGRDDAHWREHASDDVRFFVAANPGYHDGHGLLTLVPVTTGGLLRGALRFAAARLSRRLGALVARLRSRLPGQRALPPAKC